MTGLLLDGVLLFYLGTCQAICEFAFRSGGDVEGNVPFHAELWSTDGSKEGRELVRCDLAIVLIATRGIEEVGCPGDDIISNFQVNESVEKLGAFQVQVLFGP